MNGGRKKSLSNVKQLTPFRQRLVLNAQTGAVVLVQSRGRPDKTPIRVSPAPEPWRPPPRRGSLLRRARDRCELVVLAEFLEVGAREILRDRLD